MMMVWVIMEVMRFLVPLYFLFIRKYGMSVIANAGISNNRSKGFSKLNLKFVIVTPYLKVFLQLQQPLTEQQRDQDPSQVIHQIPILDLFYIFNVRIY